MTSKLKSLRIDQDGENNRKFAVKSISKTKKPPLLLPLGPSSRNPVGGSASKAS